MKEKACLDDSDIGTVPSKKKGILQGMENLVKEADGTDSVVCLFLVLQTYHFSIHAILNILSKDP